MALHPYQLGLQKPDLSWSRYRYANPVPTSLLADNIATAPSRPAMVSGYIISGYKHEIMYKQMASVALTFSRYWVRILAPASTHSEI